jgi:hypothetical protein
MRGMKPFNGLRFSGFGPRADCADILSWRRAEVRCNRELDRPASLLPNTTVGNTWACA